VEGLQLLPLFCSIRAYIRGKLGSWSLMDLDEELQQRRVAAVSQYYRFSLSFLEEAPQFHSRLLCLSPAEAVKAAPKVLAEWFATVALMANPTCEPKGCGVRSANEENIGHKF